MYTCYISPGEKMTGETLKIIRDVHQLFIEKGLRLSVAESCTGGLISHYLTWLSGSSKFFEAGVVTYSVSVQGKYTGSIFRNYRIPRRCKQ